MAPNRRGPSILGLGIVTDIIVEGAQSLRKVGVEFGVLTHSTRTFTASVDDLTVATGATAAVLGTAFVAGTVAIGLATAAAADLETQMLDVRKTTGAAVESIDMLSGSLVNMSLDTPETARGLASIAAIGGRLGIRLDEGTLAMERFTGTVQRMATVTKFSAELAAEQLAKLSNIFGLSIVDVEQMGAAMNELSNRTNATAPQISDITRRIGPMAAQFGIAIDKALALSATMIDLGLTSQLAGTNLTAIFSRMARRLPAFARQAEVSVGEFRRIFEEDAVEALILTAKSFEGLSPEEASKELIRLGLAGERVARVFLALSASTKSVSGEQSILRRNLEISNKAYADATSLQKEFDIQVSSLHNQLAILRNRFTAIVIKIGQGFLPIVKAAVKLVSGFVKVLAMIPQPVLAVVGGVAALTTGLAGLAAAFLAVALAAGVTFKVLAAGAETAAKLSSALFVASAELSSMPLLVQGLVGPFILLGNAARVAFSSGLLAGISTAQIGFAGLSTSLMTAGVSGRFMAGVLTKTVVPALTFLRTAVVLGLGPAFVGLFATIKAGFLAATAAAATFATGLTATGIGALIVAGGLLVGLIVNLFQFRSAFTGVFGSFANLIGGIFTHVSSVIKTFVKFLAIGLLLPLLPLLLGMSTAFKGIAFVVNALASQIGELFQPIAAAFDRLVGAFRRLLPEGDKNIKLFQLLGDVVKFLIFVALTPLRVTIEFVAAVINFLTGAVNAGIDAINKMTGDSQFLANTFDKVSTAVAAVIKHGKRIVSLVLPFGAAAAGINKLGEALGFVNDEQERMRNILPETVAAVSRIPSLIDERFAPVSNPLGRSARSEIDPNLVPARFDAFGNRLDPPATLPVRGPVSTPRAAVSSDTTVSAAAAQNAALVAALKTSRSQSSQTVDDGRGAPVTIDALTVQAELPIMLDGREIGRAVKTVTVEDHHRDLSAVNVESGGPSDDEDFIGINP